MDNQVQPKNAFRLEGKVIRKSTLQGGQNANTGREWYKLEIVLAMVSAKHNKTYYYPVHFWGNVAIKTSEKVNMNDYISVEGQVVTKEYRNSRTNEVDYFINLNGYGVEVLQKADTNEPAFEEEFIDVPF